MKKISLILMAMILMFSTAIASEPVTQQLQEPAHAGVILDKPFEAKKDFIGARGATSFPQPNDKVTIEDGVFTITSPSGVTIQLQLPFGWTGLTQDVSLQMLDYAGMADPLGALNYVIDNNISLLAVDLETNDNMFVFIASSGMSTLINNMDTPEMVDVVLKTYKGSAVLIGGTNYISVVEDGSLFFYTYYNGACVTFQLFIAGSEPTAEEIETLTGFVEMTNYL